jgi:hypothetical protein
MVDFGTKKVWKEKSGSVFNLDLINTGVDGHMKVSVYQDRITGKKLVYKIMNGSHWDVYVSKHGFLPIHFAKFRDGISKRDLEALRLYFTLMSPNGDDPTHYELIEGGQHA